MAGVAASGYARCFVEVEYQDAVVVELGFDKRFGAGDVDAVLADEL